MNNLLISFFSVSTNLNPIMDWDHQAEQVKNVGREYDLGFDVFLMGQLVTSPRTSETILIDT
jgi:hypothetical protein